MRFTEQVSEKIKNHPGVEWVPIDELNTIRAQDPYPPLADDLTRRFSAGEKLINPIDIWYNPTTGEIRLAVGNNRLSALGRAGWTHAPCIVRRVDWGLYLDRANGPPRPYSPVFIGVHDSFPDQGWVLPSQVGLTGLEPEEVP